MVGGLGDGAGTVADGADGAVPREEPVEGVEPGLSPATAPPEEPLLDVAGGLLRSSRAAPSVGSTDSPDEGSGDRSARVVSEEASSPTLAAVNWPTGFSAPTLRSPTLAATAPLTVVTTIAAAPAKVSARCLFMSPNVESTPTAETPRTVKNWQSSGAGAPESGRSSRPGLHHCGRRATLDL